MKSEAKEFREASRELVKNLTALSATASYARDRKEELIGWLEGDISECRNSLVRIERLLADESA